MGQSLVSELSDFTGGMNTLVAPHLISNREAVKLVNVDIRLGVLASMPNLDHVDELVNGPYFFQFNGVVYSYDSYRTNVQWDNKWYWSDGIDTGKVLADGTELPLGIKTPDDPLTQTVGAAGVLQGDLKYTYTFYSSETNVESAPAPLPLYITVDGSQVSLQGFEAFPPEADTYRIYRVGGYLSQFLMVGTSTIADFTDNLDETQIDGRPLYTLRAGPPPQFLSNLTELNGRFYGSVGNKLYYSALGNPDSWYLSDYLLLRDDIYALGSVPAGLLVMGQYYVNLLYGTQPNNFKLKLMSDQLGCIGKESIAYIGDSCIWLSNRQLVMSNGYKITDITAYKLDRIKGLIPTGAVSDNETYYLSFKPSLYPQPEVSGGDGLYPSPTLYPDAAEGVSGEDQGIIAVDFKRGQSFSYKIITYKNIRYIDIVDAEIHVSTGEFNSTEVPCDATMFADCGYYVACSPFAINRMNVYAAQGLTKLQYISPFLVDRSRTTMKQYDKVRVVFSGDFNIKVVFDNGEIAVEQDISSETNTQIIIGIPNKNNNSSGIMFMVEGTGLIQSIQYSWKPRELVN